MGGSGRGGVKGNLDALLNGSFNLGKDGFLFFERMGSLKGCDVMDPSGKNFFLLLFDRGMKGWAEVFWVNVVWMLWVRFDPPAEYKRCLDNSFLGCIPAVFSVDKFYPEVGVVGVDEFDRDVALLFGVDVIPGIRVSVSLVFKVRLFCDVRWEIILLSPVNSFVFISEFSDKDYCCQFVRVLSCVSRTFEKSLTYVKVH